MKSHPYADLFPMMTDAELDLMAADIKGGQRSPVILDQHGLVVDGRNRLAACERAGLEPVTEVRTFPDDRAVLAFIVSANLHRRHLSETQRAMIAARIATMKSGARTDLGPIGPRSEVSRAEAASQLNVSERSVGRARKVQKDAVPEIRQMVESGDLKVLPAAEVAALPAEEQQEMARLGAEEITRRQSAARRKKPAAGSPPSPGDNGRSGKTPVGLVHANEAINSLKRIPKDDPHRQDAYRMVRKWMRHNP